MGDGSLCPWEYVWGGNGTHRQEDLQCAAERFDIGVVKQAASDRDDMVVLQGQAGVQDRGHQAAWPILHPPGAVQGCVEGHDEVPVLGAEGPGILSRAGGSFPGSTSHLDLALEPPVWFVRVQRRRNLQVHRWPLGGT